MRRWEGGDARLQSFAWHHVQGRMIDGLRQFGNIVRSTGKPKLETAQLSAVWDPDGDTWPHGNPVVDCLAEDPTRTTRAEAFWEVVRRTLTRQVGSLEGNRLADVLDGYYARGRTNAEIGATLGISESRVSQLKIRAEMLLSTASDEMRDAAEILLTKGGVP